MNEEKEVKKLDEIAEKYANDVFSGNDKDSVYYRSILICAYKDGYKNGEKDTNEYYQKNEDELYKSYSERLKELDVRYEKQKEINKELVDENHNLKVKKVYEQKFEKLYKDCVNEAIELKKDKKLLQNENGKLWEKISALEEGKKELEKQIEIMKCCGNCRYHNFTDGCQIYNVKKINCYGIDEWELKK